MIDIIHRLKIHDKSSPSLKDILLLIINELWSEKGNSQSNHVSCIAS